MYICRQHVTVHVFVSLMQGFAAHRRMHHSCLFNMLRKWHGGVLAADGCIYATRQNGLTGVQNHKGHTLSWGVGGGVAGWLGGWVAGWLGGWVAGWLGGWVGGGWVGGWVWGGVGWRGVG